MHMRDKKKASEKLREGSEEGNRERPGEKTPSKSSLIMLSAVYVQLQQTLNFGRSMRAENDTAEFGENDYVVMLTKVHRSVQQNFLILREARSGK